MDGRSSPALVALHRMLTHVGDGVDLVLLALQLPVVVVSLALRRQVPDTHSKLQRLALGVSGWGSSWAETSYGLLLDGPKRMRAGLLYLLQAVGQVYNTNPTDFFFKYKKEHFVLQTSQPGVSLSLKNLFLDQGSRPGVSHRAVTASVLLLFFSL